MSIVDMQNDQLQVVIRRVIGFLISIIIALLVSAGYIIVLEVHDKIRKCSTMNSYYTIMLRIFASETLNPTAIRRSYHYIGN